MRPTLTLTRGLPGSGKTTLAHDLRQLAGQRFDYLPVSPVSAPNATGIDTGACFGGPLTGLILDDNNKPSGYLTSSESWDEV